MTRSRLAARVLVCAAVCAMVGGLGCAKRPAECAPALAERQKALDGKGTYALDARKAAAALVERALLAAAAQDDRFAVMRDYDEPKKLCVEAARALDEAEAAVARAKVTEERITKRDADAQKALRSLDARLVLARGLADSGVVDAQATAALRTLVQSGAESKRALDRARAEQRATGFGLDPSAFDAASDRAIGLIDEVRTTTLGISDQIATRCRLKLTGQELAEATLRAHAEWILLDVPGVPARRVVILRVDRDKQTCAVAYDRPAAPTTIETLEGELLHWTVPGTIEHKILVGFQKASAWFLEGTRFVRYPHERSAGFSKACVGSVTCEKPRLTSRTLESSCECRPPSGAGGARLLPSDIARTGRYAWDGSRVIAEP